MNPAVITTERRSIWTKAHIYTQGMMSGSFVKGTYIAWYDFRILWSKTNYIARHDYRICFLQKVYTWYDFRILHYKQVCCFVLLQDPVTWESILPDMISESYILRRYTAWYDSRILCIKKVDCKFWFQSKWCTLFRQHYVWDCVCSQHRQPQGPTQQGHQEHHADSSKGTFRC